MPILLLLLCNIGRGVLHCRTIIESNLFLLLFGTLLVKSTKANLRTHVTPIYFQENRRLDLKTD